MARILLVNRRPVDTHRGRGTHHFEPVAVDVAATRCEDHAVTFAAALHAEFIRRRSVNRRYSLRAFAAALGISHSAASRLRRGGQQPSDTTIMRIGRRLNWSASRIASFIVEQRISRLTAAASSREFVADARWLASRTNLSLDDIQLILHDALRTGRLEMTTADSWTVKE